MPTTQNPFSAAYSAIIAAWQAWPALTALVRPGNIINQQSPPFQPKLNVNAGDRAELKLGEKRLGAKPFTVNSLGVFCAAEYPVQVASGQLSLDKLNLIVWEIGRALANAGPFLGASGASKWEFVADASVVNNDPEAKRPDWSSIAVVRVEFNLNRDTYLATTYT